MLQQGIAAEEVVQEPISSLGAMRRSMTVRSGALRALAADLARNTSPWITAAEERTASGRRERAA